MSVGVVDQNGRELLHHVISNTSFEPVVGHTGTAVHFSRGGEVFLAVIADGGRDQPRSLLLVFNSAGRLVWQEEMNLIRAAIAVTRTTENGEVLLLAGRDGVLEYSLGSIPK
jgi:hypothetical protein